MANNERVTNLVIRAKDEYSKVLKNLEAQQKRLSAAAQATNRRMLTGFAAKEIQDAQRNYKALVADVDRYRAAQEKAARTGSLTTVEMRELGDTIALTRRRAQEAVATYAQKTAALNKLKTGATSGFAAFDRLAVSMQKSTVSTGAEGAAVQGVVADLKILDQQTRRVVSSQNAAAAATDKAGAAFNRRSKNGRKGESADVEVYGLKPYQLTNLGYQINDVVSGLSMGQNPIQILAQQAGQFVQIWPGVMTGLARSIPLIAGVTAVLSPFIAALVEVGSKSRALTEFSNRLSVMADGARYSAEALTDITRNFEELRPLLEAGFGQDQLRGFFDLAKVLSRANGESITENVKTLAEAFSGGVDGVRELDKSLQFLTAEQYANIRAMEASGDKTGALEAAQKALETRYEAFSGKARGPWSQAAENLGQAWNRLIKWIATTAPITITIGVFNKLGQSIEYITAGLNILSGKLGGQFQLPEGSLAQQYGQLRKQREELQKMIELSRQSDEAMFGPNAKDSSQTELLKKQLQEVLKAYDDVVSKINEAGKAEQQSTSETEEQKKNRADILLTINDQVRALQQQADLAKMTERQQFIENQLLEAKNRALEAGVTLRGEELEILKRQAGETFDAQNTKSVSGNLVDKIVGVESGGNASAKNPLSSATGLGQFIESTWLTLFRKYFPAQAASMTEQQILELRKDADTSRAMIELYAQENAKILKAAGVSVNDAALYLAHFLGPGGAAGLLAARAGTPVSDILSSGQINANQSILQGKTNDEVIAWAQKKMGISESELAVQNRIAELDADRLKTSKEYTEDYQKRIEAQKFELDLASKSAREAAIAKALQEEELKAKEAGKTLTQQQIAEITKLTAANFDRANAETRVNELMEQRTLLMESLTLAQEAGDATKVAQIVEQIKGTEDALNTAIDKAIAFYQAIGGPAADSAILKLQNVKAAVGDIVKDMSTKYLPTAEEINDQIVDMGGNAFTAFAQAIAQGENAWQAFTNAVLQGLADIIIELGKAIVKQALFNALTGGGTNTSGGIGGWLSGLVGGLFGVAHTGGVIGKTKLQTRMVNPAVFANAQRYHGGGIISGLRSNEVPIIAEAGEEMLTAKDPRHSANGGGSGAMNVKIVNVLDPSEILEAAVESVPGEKIMVNHMSRRKGAYNSALAR